MDWGLDLKKFKEWLIEKGISEQYWGGQIKKTTLLRMQFIRETNPEKYKEIMEHIGENAKKANYDLKARFVDMLGGECEKCGYKFCLGALEFHHKNPKDKWSKTTFSGYQQDPQRFEKDVKEGKIQLVCANCHCELYSKDKKQHRVWFKYKEFE